jgi:hypothetical protein
MNTNLFFHIGLPKTGTTTIQHVIRQDERINVAGTRYFNRFEYWEKPFGLLKPDKVNLISEENQVLQMGDFGKFTLFLSRIKQFSPEAHVILTLREQRALLESRYKYQFDWHGGYTKDFSTWLRSGQGMDYLSLCMYSTLYDTLLAFFPAGQIHFLLFEDLKNDYRGFFRSLYKIFKLEAPEELLKEPVIQNPSLSEPVLRSIRRWNKLKILHNDSWLSRYEFALIRKLAALVNRGNSSVSDFRWENIEVKEKIEEDFRNQNNALAERGVIAMEKLKKYNYLVG